MASGLGITLGIVAGAVAVGLTAGLAAPYIGIGVIGSASVIGGFTFAGGTALAVGALALGAGLALTQSAATPDPISQIHRQLATTDDPESPWEWVYGEVIKGGFRAWQGVGGNKDKYSGADDVLACHACEALLAIQFGDWYLPIVTDNAGDANANGKGLIRNADRTTPYADVPDDWLVPVPGPNSPFHANDQSQVNNDDTWHIAVRFRPADQTATQDLMSTIFGTKYNSVARKFTGHTVCHIVFRVRTNLGISTGPPPTVLYHLRGKNDIRDHTGIGSEDYRNNAALVFCDYTREQLGLGPTDYANLQAAATECDDTTWDPQSTAARYAFHGVIRDDMDIPEALRLISTHMAGGWCERGDKIVLWTGTAKTPWADGPLVPDDFAGPVTIMPPDEDAWANTLTPHFVPRTAEDEDGNTMLYGKMEPVKQEVTSSTYVTEDGGEVLRQDIKFQACPLSRRAKFMAWTALKQMRLGASYVRRFKKRALVLEVGDVVELDDPDWVPNGTLFQVASKSGPDPRDFSVELGLVRYEDAIYTPGATVTEDAIGVVPKNRSSTVPAITGLAATVHKVRVSPDGSINVDAAVTWDAIDNLLVNSGGHVRIGWKEAAQSWPQQSTTVDGDAIRAIISGFELLTAYHIRVRAEGVPGAGREGKPLGEWSADLSFTPGAGTVLRIPGAAASLNISENLHNNPNFNQGPMPGDTDPVGWELESAASGTTAWSSATGRFGIGYVLVSIVSDTRRVRQSELTPVIPGERYLSRYFMRLTTGSSDWKGLINIQLYDDDETFIQTLAVANVEFSDTGWVRLRHGWTVPSDDSIRYARFQASIQLPASPSGAFGIRIDGTKTARVFGGKSSMLATTQDVNAAGGGDGNVWTNIRRVTSGSPGDPVSLSCSFYARVGDEGLSNAVVLQVRAVRWDADGTSNLTELLASTDLGEEFGPVSPQGDWGAWQHFTITAFDTTEARGEFVYGFQFRASRVNGKAAVKYRVMEWRIEDESGTV